VVLLAVACTPEVDQRETQPAALSQAEREEIEQTLLRWADQWNEGSLTGDLSILERILARDFIYTINNGKVHDKASFIALRANNPVALTSLDQRGISIHWYGDNVVVLTGTTTGTGTDADGTQVSGSSAWTNVYVQRDGEWQCVVGHSTPISQ
jgi:ketosteroid isomerase-like protein